MATVISSQPRLVLPALAPVYSALSPFMEPLVRVTAGLLLVPHGIAKLQGGLGGTAEFLASVGFVPGMFWALTIVLVEVVGGLLLALGLFTRPVAAAIVAFMAQAAVFHAGQGLFWNDGGFEYPLFWGIVAFTFLVRGGGAYSLDAKLSREI